MITHITDMSTRESAIKSIQAIGEYISDHADNLLGEYPSGLMSLSITANFDASCVATIDVLRSHIVTNRNA